MGRGCAVSMPSGHEGGRGQGRCGEHATDLRRGRVRLEYIVLCAPPLKAILDEIGLLQCLLALAEAEEREGVLAVRLVLLGVEVLHGAGDLLTRVLTRENTIIASWRRRDAGEGHHVHVQRRLAEGLKTANRGGEGG